MHTLQTHNIHTQIYIGHIHTYQTHSTHTHKHAHTSTNTKKFSFQSTKLNKLGLLIKKSSICNTDQNYLESIKYNVLKLANKLSDI